ncbi:iron complex transport system substrate-binding protein [Lipingzhangella halophila]|uniref:Iron complex transport system substrate-binding protein n=1 Tax=Lipingzhangella halophila TaxID=1783352 RepID=A0A7W7RKN3_9ACTN|nr:ABC transporter substrate-binding protein [Lipingzhangella halophila]MBB4933562.1 iron complex transport system substrate-binding protein [Lipingzhangella halophila]
MRTARRTSAVLLATALTLSACGTSEPSEPEGAGDGEFPVTVTDARGEVTLDAEPSRIVSLSPTTTEMLFEIGAGDQVVAADEHSNYPEEAPDTDLSGFNPSVEAVVENDPDLVVVARNAEDAADQLEAVDIPVLVLSSGETLEDTYAQMRLLGEATGHADEADEAADRVETEFDDIVAETQEQTGDVGLSVYHEVDDAMHSASSATFIGQVYERFGLRNIADQAEDGGGYPQLSSEFIVDADPDLIFLSYDTDGAVEGLAERSAFDTVTAVREDHVAMLDPDVSSRWGPRVVELAEDVSEALVAVEGS